MRSSVAEQEEDMPGLSENRLSNDTSAGDGA